MAFTKFRFNRSALAIVLLILLPAKRLEALHDSTFADGMRESLSDLNKILQDSPQNSCSLHITLIKFEDPKIDFIEFSLPLIINFNNMGIHNVTTTSTL